MGIQDRKSRERESLKKLILSCAHEIVRKGGLNALTMRAIADQIEYSQSKIYEFFSNKDQLCEVLCQDHCENLLNALRQISTTTKPDHYLNKLVKTTMEYHASNPHSDNLLTLVCFGPERFHPPEAFQTIEDLFIEALKNLKSPALKTQSELLSALDIIRCLFIGVSNLMVTETSLKGRMRGLDIIENALTTLLKGWKS